MAQTLTARLLAHMRRSQSRLRVALARATGTDISPGCQLGRGCDLQLGLAPPRRGTISLGSDCDLSAGVILYPYGGSIRLGDRVHLGPGSVIYGHGGVEIGDDVLVAMHCRVLSSEHAVPAMGTAIRSLGDVTKATRIGPDVWLGAGVTVLGGITIGEGCIVGAGAVVTRDLPPGSIAVGVPARVVGQRQP